jgi:hypothetical protein
MLLYIIKCDCLIINQCIKECNNISLFLLFCMSLILTFFLSKTIFGTICLSDEFSVLGWALLSRFSVQLDYQHPNDISKNRCDHSTHPGDTMPNQQFHFCSKIHILGVSVFGEAGYFAPYASYLSVLFQCFIYQMFQAAIGLSNEPTQSLIGPTIAEIRALTKVYRDLWDTLYGGRPSYVLLLPSHRLAESTRLSGTKQ